MTPDRCPVSPIGCLELPSCPEGTCAREIDAIPSIEVAAIKALAEYEAKHRVTLSALDRLTFKIAFSDGAGWALAQARRVIREAA